MGSGTRLHQAYKKYGLECFNKEILQFYNGIDELNQGEIYWIAKLNATNPEIGYNLTYGGDGQLGREPWNKGKPGINKGKTFSEEHRRKLSESHKGKLCGENNGMYGKPFSEEHRRKMSESMKLAWQKRKLAKLNQQNNG